MSSRSRKPISLASIAQENIIQTPSKRPRKQGPDSSSITVSTSSFYGTSSTRPKVQRKSTDFVIVWQSFKLFIHTDEDIEKSSMLALEQCMTCDAIHEEKPLLVCAIVLWLVAKEYQFNQNRPKTVTISEVLNVVYNISKQRNVELIAQDLNVFLNMVNLLQPVLSYTTVVTQHAQKEIHLCQIYAEAYQVLQTTFEALTNRNVRQLKPDDAKDTYVGDLMTFTWFLFLSASNILIGPVPEDMMAVRALVLYCSTFVLTQASPIARCPEGGRDWLMVMEEVKQRLCEQNQLPLAQYEVLESEFMSSFLVSHLVGTPVFKYKNLVALHEALPWPRYEGSLEQGRTSFLMSNLEQIRNRYAAGIHESGSEVDGRIFVTEVRPMATPRRFIRKQNAAVIGSVRASPGVKGLNAALNRVRALNSSMMSTPLSAKVGGTKVRQGDEDFYTMQRRLDQLLSPEPTDPFKSMQKLLGPDNDTSILRSIADREKSIVQYLVHRDPSSAAVWALGVKLYHRLANNLMQSYQSKSRKISSLELLKDGSFHRSLLLIAFECVRYGFKVVSLSFPDLFHLIGPRTVEFCLVLALVVERESWLSWTLIKRLKELEERMIESELWRDDGFYNLLLLRNQNDVDFGSISMTIFCCTDLVSDTHENHLVVKEQGVVQGIIDIIVAKIRVLAFLRLKDLATKLGMPEQIAERVWMATEHVLNTEHQSRLLFERHLDLVLLCSLFAVARMSEMSLTFSEIRQVYQTQPHYLADVLDNIKSPDLSSHMDLISYYNHVFLPAMKTFIAQDLQARRTGQTPVVKRRDGLRMAMLTPARKNGPIMTPVTKKLYNHGEIEARPVGGLTPRPSPFNLPMPSSSRRRQ